MKSVIGIVAAVGLTAGVATAEEKSAGQSLMEEGARLFFKGLQDEMAPALEDFRALIDEVGPGMQAFLEEMGPRLGAVLSKVEDWSQYHAPEILPNGDIILRKKAPEEMEVPETDDTSEGVEL